MLWNLKKSMFLSLHFSKNWIIIRHWPIIFKEYIKTINQFIPVTSTKYREHSLIIRSKKHGKEIKSPIPVQASERRTQACTHRRIRVFRRRVIVLEMPKNREPSWIQEEKTKQKRSHDTKQHVLQSRHIVCHEKVLCKGNFRSREFKRVCLWYLWNPIPSLVRKSWSISVNLSNCSPRRFAEYTVFIYLKFFKTQIYEFIFVANVLMVQNFTVFRFKWDE